MLKRKPRSQETKRKISLAHIGEKNHMFGKHHSEEAKLKISIALKKAYAEGKFENRFNQEVRKKMSRIKKEQYKLGVMVHPLKGKHHSEQTKKKISDTKRKYFKDNPEIVKNYLISNWIKKNGAWNKGIYGERNSRWQGGKSYEKYTLNFTKKFKHEIRQRDNYVCIKCGIHQEKLSRILDIHHIDYIKENTIKENCCSLCRRCNVEVNSNRTSWTKFFQSLLAERYGYKYSEDGKVILELKSLLNNDNK